MKRLPFKGRPYLCLLIIGCFFLPAYHSVSAFGFISFALDQAKLHKEITTGDAFIVLLPVVLIPVAALFILVRSLLKKSSSIAITGLPFILLIFSMVLLSFSGSNGENGFTMPRALLHMQPAFYLAGLACILLVFTKNRKRRRLRLKKYSQAMASGEPAITQP